MPPKKIRKKKYSRTFRALYYWGKILGINSLNLTKNNEIKFSYSGIFYACFLATGCSYMFYREWIARSNVVLSIDTPIAKIVGFITATCGYLGISLTWLIFGFFQNRVISIVESFAKAERTSRKLEIPENYEKHYRKIGIHLGIIIVYHIIFVIYRSVALVSSSNVRISAYPFFQGFHIVSYNSLLIFVWCVMIVREKFHRLNDKVRLLWKDNDAQIRELDPRVSTGLIRTSRLYTSLLSDRIDQISQLHRELRDVIDRIKEHFDFLVLLNMTYLLSTLTLDTYHAGRHLLSNVLNPGTEILFLYTDCCRILVHVIILSIISNVCGSTSDEANETGNVLHAMLNECETYGALPEAAKFHILSLDLLENKMKISIFDCLNLDHFCVFRVLITVITYLVIMLQFNI